MSDTATTVSTVILCVAGYLLIGTLAAAILIRLGGDMGSDNAMYVVLWPVIIPMLAVVGTVVWLGNVATAIGNAKPGPPADEWEGWDADQP